MLAKSGPVIFFTNAIANKFGLCLGKSWEVNSAPHMSLYFSTEPCAIEVELSSTKSFNRLIIVSFCLVMIFKYLLVVSLPELSALTLRILLGSEDATAPEQDPRFGVIADNPGLSVVQGAGGEKMFHADENPPATDPVVTFEADNKKKWN